MVQSGDNTILCTSSPPHTLRRIINRGSSALPHMRNHTDVLAATTLAENCIHRITGSCKLAMAVPDENVLGLYS